MWAKSKMILLSLVITCVACGQRHRIYSPEIPVAVDRNGDSVSAPIESGKKVIHFFTPRQMRDVLSHTPRGKINRIIRENQDWQFLFYILCKPEDKEFIIKLLDTYGCEFQVLLDYNDVFRKQNSRLEKDVECIGYIVDSNQNWVGLSVIGDTRSPFDATFKRAKRIVK